LCPGWHDHARTSKRWFICHWLLRWHRIVLRYPISMKGAKIDMRTGRSRDSFRRYGVFLGAISVFLLLAAAAHGQTWVSTATKAVGPALKNAIPLGALPATTPLHLVVGLKMQNADQVQPTLKRMITPGDPLYGTSLTVDQFVAQFGPAPADVQAVQNYLANYGFSNIQVEPNQLMVQADATAQQAQAAFNTALRSPSATCCVQEESSRKIECRTLPRER
jgi:hypothetical protein